MTMKLPWLALALAIATTPAFAAPYIYPSKGQSPERQAKDQGECHVWATQQTGFDPANPPPPPAASQQPVTQGGVVKGGARGAAMGAVGGAIAGDAGKGAAAGAAMGAMAGGMRRADAYRAQAAQQKQVQGQYQQQMAAAQSSYNRAFTACMEGRGYTVN